MEVDGFHIRVDLTGQNNKVEHYSIRWLLSGQQQYVYMQYEIYLVSDEQVLFLVVHCFSLFSSFQHDHTRSIFVGNLPFGKSTHQIARHLPNFFYCSVTLTLHGALYKLIPVRVCYGVWRNVCFKTNVVICFVKGLIWVKWNPSHLCHLISYWHIYFRAFSTLINFCVIQH